MFRGFFSGMLCGTAVSALGAGAVSVAVSWPEMVRLAPTPAVVAEAPKAALVPAAPVDTPAAPETVADVVKPEAPGESAVPEADAMASVDTGSALPKASPQPVQQATLPSAPAPQDAPEIAVADAAAPEAAQAAEPEAPDTDVLAGLDTGPALPKDGPEVPETNAALQAPEAGDEPAVTVAIAPAPETAGAEALDPPAGDALAGLDTTPALPKAAPRAGIEPVTPDTPVAGTEDAPQIVAGAEEAPASAAPAVVPEVSADAGPVDGSAPAVPQETAEAMPDPEAGEEVEQTAEAPSQSTLPNVINGDPEPEVTQDAARPSIGRPATVLVRRGDGGLSSRLPTIGGTVARGEAAPDPQAEPDAQAAPEGASALAQYANPVDVPEGRPRVAVILIDDLNGPIGANAVGAFPFPVTFAVDAAAPGAAEAMRHYRDKGFEVMALADMPAGSQPSDVEVALGAMLNAVPESVAVLGAPGGGLQDSRAVTEQAISVVGRSGRGIVFQRKGLNGGAASATREGVPSGTVFRALDEDGTGSGDVRKALNQAAFRARQDGVVILQGTMQADTISGLLLWAMSDDAEQVALVPVSQALSQPGESGSATADAGQ